MLSSVVASINVVPVRLMRRLACQRKSAPMIGCWMAAGCQQETPGKNAILKSMVAVNFVFAIG